MRISRERLDIALARKCLDVSGLSKMAKIPRSTIDSAMNNDGKVRTSTAGKIARALGVDVTEILAD